MLDWRREDSAYAGATAVAAALVAYLVAANFGLVPSPFGLKGAERRGELILPALVAAPAIVGGTATVPPGQPIANPPLAGTNPTDDARPSAAFTTEDGATVTGVTQSAEVLGTATDGRSGVGEVAVTFQPSSGEATRVPARLDCSDSSRRRCTWAAEAPAVAATYDVTATVTDRAENSDTAGPISVTVVNPGGPVEDLLGDVLDGLGNLLG
jgi:hypothetical protein